MNNFQSHIKTTLKKILFIVIGLSSLAICKGGQNKYVASDTAMLKKPDSPENDTFKKNPECFKKDTLLNDSSSFNKPFYYKDIDFDGEDELLIKTGIDSQWNGYYYNAFKLFKDSADKVVSTKQLTDEPFTKIDSYTEFDSANKAIILYFYNGAKESYYKKYKRVNNPVCASSQFQLTEIGDCVSDRKLTTLSDIDMSLKPKDFPNTPLIKDLLDLYNSTTILNSLYHDFNIAKRFNWNLREAMSKLNCSIISNGTIRKHTQDYKQSILSILSRNMSAIDAESSPKAASARDTLARKIVECFNVTDNIYQMYDSIARGAIIETEEQIKDGTDCKILIDNITDFNKKCLYTLAAYYSSNYYTSSSLAIKPLRELMESKQYSIYIYEIWRIWRFISGNGGWLLDAPEEEYNAMKIVCLKTILAQIIQHPDDAMAINQFILLATNREI